MQRRQNPRERFEMEAHSKSTDGEVLALIDRAFEQQKRPEHFIPNWQVSKETSAYEKMFEARSLKTLTRNDVGDIGRDPLNFISTDGFLYFFPALARFALEETSGDGRTWFGVRLFGYLTYMLAMNPHLRACDEKQTRAVVTLLEHLKSARSFHLEEWAAQEDLRIALEIWSGR